MLKMNNVQKKGCALEPCSGRSAVNSSAYWFDRGSADSSACLAIRAQGYNTLIKFKGSYWIIYVKCLASDITFK